MTTTFTSTQKRLFVWLALFMTPFSGFTVDIYVPSLPAIHSYFHVSSSAVQLSMTFYLIGVALSMLFIGGLADAWGRRRLIIFSSLLYTIASLAIPHSPNIQTLWLLRFLQGIFVSGVTSPSRAIFADVLEGEAFKKAIALMAIIWCVGPIVAPAIGGYLQVDFGWHAPFYFLGVFGAVVCLSSLFLLKETLAEQKPFCFKAMCANYLMLIKNKYFVLMSASCAAMYSLIILFAIVGPFLIEKRLGYSAIFYGHIALALGVSWLIGNTAFRVLIKYPRAKRIIPALIIAFVATLIMLLLALAGKMSVATITIPAFITIIVLGLLFPDYFSTCLGAFPKAAASAGSLIMTGNMLGTALVSALGSAMLVTTQTPLASFYFVIVILICIFSFFILRLTPGK